MVMFAACVAALLYLVPVAMVVFDWSDRRDVSASTLALAIPNAVALDLLAVLFLALFVRVDAAILCVRAVWLLLGVGLFLRRRAAGRGLIAAEIDWPKLGAVLGAAILALCMSLSWSRKYSVWDRFWHVPLAASIRGQRLPFQNVYYSQSSLHYHFSGDVLAASLQALSFDVIHSDHALSLAHDLMFALTGGCLGLLLWGFGHRSFFAVILGVLAVLLNGPVSFLRGEGAAGLHGFSVLNFFTMSFRPHVSIAGLLFVGFFGAVVLHLQEETAERAETGPFIYRGSSTLLITTALLGITDETSTGLLGLALGTAWLMHAAIVHPDRRRGVLVLFGLAVAFIGVNLLYRGSLSPGGPVSTMKFVPWRAAGYFKPPVELSASSEGWRLLLFDVLAIPTALLGLFLLYLGKEKSAGLRVALIFLLVLAATSLLGLTATEVNGEAKEAHRFATAALFGAPLFALAWLPRIAHGGTAKLLLLAALLLPASSTASWFRNAVPQELAVELQPLLGTINCRAVAEARAFERAHATYVSKPAWYVWSGCRPVISTGSKAPQWSLPIFGPQIGLPALEILEKSLLDSNDSLRVICAPGSSADPDPVCRFAVERGQCRMVGPTLQKCLMSPQERLTLMSALAR